MSTQRHVVPGSTLLVLLVVLLAADPAEAIKRRAFATSIAGNANLGTWADADGATGAEAGNNICQALAADAGLSNPGSFRAWLSTDATDAYCNVQGLTGDRAGDCAGQSLPIQGPWFLPGGITGFAGGLDELTAVRAEIYRPILVDEFGDLVVGFGAVWTGTNGQGVRFGADCDGWTSNDPEEFGYLGVTHGTTGTWTASGAVGCSTSARLLCFESLFGEEVPRPHSPGALAFVTSAFGNGELGSWPEATGSGIAAGDAICRQLALDAALPSPDSFVAWLSDASIDAADRITTAGPFRRLDGFEIASSRADLLDGTTLNSIHVDELGRYADADFRVWTGTNGFGETASAHCSGWQAPGATGRTGRSSYARTLGWTTYNTHPCTTDAHLYCFSNVVTLFWDGFEITGDTSRWSTVTP